MNQYSFWKYLLLVVVLISGGIYAMPNLYGEDPSVLISLRNQQVDEATQLKVDELLTQASIQKKSSELKNNKLLIRFDSVETQLIAASTVKSFDFISRNSDYTVALNLAPATPEWLQSLGALPMYLGLDLRGGVHFLLEVDMESVVKNMESDITSEMRSYLREEKVRYRGIKASDGSITIQFRDVEGMEQGESKLKSQFRDLEYTSKEDDLKVFATITEKTLRAERKSAIQQNVTTLRNRVNELGVAEPVIQQQGENRIVVQLPGVQDTARAKDILGATATLEFRLTQGTRLEWMDAENGGSIPINAKLYHERNGDPVLLKRRVIVTGDQINSASSTIDTQSGSPAVSVRLDGKGAKKMGETTRENIKKPMAVVFIENKIVTKMVDGKKVKVRTHKEEVINIATIQGQFSKQFQITGLESFEARDLALLLRAGALKAPVEIVEERTVGPSLGKDNIEQGFNSVMIGFCLVLVFMVVYYRSFGLIANVALTANLVLITAVLSLMQATLTLPGIAGIVLTVGMAVDANVLIFERIREELRLGNSPQASIHAGYEKAFSTIADANVTTLIAAIVLFSLGTGPVKGFAITLSIGILTSMFTAIMGTRALVNLFYGGRNLKSISI
ncbi:MAG: protein translocase subunit SecD [endosymbiont of Galathealinum brachiosum]|uniref:Protein translocase subunit SecD n=1 Tax=endosymbiont of Galathealinum brachiosum TaxID=2200906 RepID=A0A370DIJ9_9GAMM|nr:MAG: protein translocase subunit SecD [endosymbiont of Galathealinum brachiosum]